MRYQRARNVFWMADALRQRHPVLNGPVRRLALRQVLREEGIRVTRAAIKRRAYIDGADGVFVITVRHDLDGVALTKVLLHEYAHRHLHMGDAAEERGEVTRQLFPCRPDDPREAEADLLAAILWYGEDATPDFHPIAMLAAAVDAASYRQLAVKEPEQLQLGIQQGAPKFIRPPTAKATSAGDPGGFTSQDVWPRRERYKGPKLRVGVSHDSLLFDWSRDGKPLGFFAGNRGWCDVWDTMAPLKGKRAREILVCGDRRAQWRDFVFSTTERYRYEFREREKRGRSPKELTKQLELAAAVPMKAPISVRLLFRARASEPQSSPEKES